MRLSALLALAFLTTPAFAQTDPAQEAVTAYALYQQDVTDLLGAEISSGPALDTALALAARHDAARVSRGWIAYGAMTATQSPSFVAGVRSRVRAAGRAAVLRQLRRDLTYARRRPPGADEAIQLILQSAAADGARMTAAGHRYTGIAQSLDQGVWPAPASGDRNARHDRLRASTTEQRTLAPALAQRVYVGPLSATPLMNADAFGGRRFWDAAAGRASPTPPRFTWAIGADRQSAVDRMLTLAALIIIEAETQERIRVAAMLDDAPSRECLEMQQLTFRQCASVAHDPNEDAYCLARHGLTGPAACFANIARTP
ncbi:hypothetical protein [Terricaulis silvestris]|uniref:Uncharacterized protein n=1 Tax=Terricaulis silvestris TaxID=2686094 RepID=A0A6I6MM42_9CAUL|nr:hypothetical protein [Terricaulis silvestris]QGZ94296.1 hypothetical protein DSM104635_01112 [Terricaulis silvestris]